MLERIISAIERQKPDEGGGAKSWWRWPLLIVLVIAGLTVAAWISTRHQRELAKLRHDKFKHGERAKQARLDASVSASETEKAHHIAEANRQRYYANEMDTDIREAEARYAKHRDRIDRISWGDLPRGD